MRSDSEDEKQRLQAVYAGMTEGELRKIADDATSLTDDALRALKEEILRKRLDISLESTPHPIREEELQRLTTIREFRDLPEAELAKGLLESAGIECYFADDNIVRMDWFYSNAVHGIKLKVRQEDAAEATEILDQPIPANFDVEGVGEFEQPRCPKCQSLDVTFQELNEPVAYTSAWLRLPLPVHRRAWRCKSCSQEWEGTEARES